MRMNLVLALAGIIALAGCGNSSTTTGTATAPSAGEKLKQDMSTVGHDIKDAATQAASEAKPAVQEAKDKGQVLIHEGAQKVADWTATQPATTQATMPAMQQ